MGPGMKGCASGVNPSFRGKKATLLKAVFRYKRVWFVLPALLWGL